MSEQTLTAWGARPNTDGGRRFAFPDPPTVRYLKRPGLLSGEALLLEISAERLGLLVREPLAPDAVLLVRLWSTTPGATHTRLARVVGTDMRPGGRDWRADCRLTPPLSEDELARAREMGGLSD